MSKEVWKEFEENPLTHSAAHYLMTIHELLETHGYARVTDIAKRMNITRGSASISLRPLKKRGWVVEDENRFLQLSAEGRRLALVVEQNDELLEKFFGEVLGVGAEQAEIDACKIEHLLSVESSLKLAAFIRCLADNPAIAKKIQAHMGEQAKSCSHDAQDCPMCDKICFHDASVPRRAGVAERTKSAAASRAA